MSRPRPHGFSVARDADRCGEHFVVGIGAICFNVSTADSQGTLLVLELTHHGTGGPARHLHHAQDEWFYVVAGAYIIEVGRERFQLPPGDSVFAPRHVPHAWAHVGDAPGRLVVTLTPAGQLEAFLRDISRANAMAPRDPAQWRRYGMELLGPPLAVNGRAAPAQPAIE